MSIENNPHSSLSTTALRGVLWTASPFSLQLLIGVLFYVFVPTEDMGRFEYALILVMFLALVADLGLGSALVQNRKTSDDHFHAAFWTNAVVGLALTVIVLVTAPYLAKYVSSSDNHEMAQVLRVMVLLLPFAAVSGVFRAHLQRNLRFRRMAGAEVFSIVAYSIAAVSMLSAFGVMSAVVSAVIREFALLLGLWRASYWTPRLRFRFNLLRELFRFGLNLTGSRCVNYANNNLPGLVIFPLLGETALAYYRFAHRLTLMPLARISAVVMRVFFPTFASIQDNDELLRRGYLRTVQSIALFFWPLLTVFAFAPEALELLRHIDGRDLRPATLPLQLLGVAAFLKAMGAAVGSIFLAKGRPNWLLYWSIFSFAVLLPALFISIAYGVDGVAAVIAITAFLFLVISQHFTNRLIGLKFADFVLALRRPATVTAFVLACLWGVRTTVLVEDLHLCAIGAGIWVMATLVGMRLFAWRLCTGLWRTARGGTNRDEEAIEVPSDSSTP